MAFAACPLDIRDSNEGLPDVALNQEITTGNSKHTVQPVYCDYLYCYYLNCYNLCIGYNLCIVIIYIVII